MSGQVPVAFRSLQVKRPEMVADWPALAPLSMAEVREIAQALWASQAVTEHDLAFRVRVARLFDALMQGKTPNLCDMIRGRPRRAEEA